MKNNTKERFARALMIMTEVMAVMLTAFLVVVFIGSGDTAHEWIKIVVKVELVVLCTVLVILSMMILTSKNKKNE
jgi:hypothetical protein